MTVYANQSFCVVIPARYNSSRYPGKPLAELCGPDGSKSLIRRTWETACQASSPDHVYIATDSDIIKAHCDTFGANTIITPSQCRNGTERVAAALASLSLRYEIIVNLQGDAPLTPHWFITDLVASLSKQTDVAVATPVLRCDQDAYLNLVNDRRAGRVGGTTALVSTSGTALYFSKEVLPYIDPTLSTSEFNKVLHHVGAYAYRPEALSAYINADTGFYEISEGLEQLRFLEHGHKILCVEVDARGKKFWELNNPIDVKRIESYLNEPHNQS